MMESNSPLSSDSNPSEFAFPPEDPISEEDKLRLSISNLESINHKASEREQELVDQLEKVTTQLHLTEKDLIDAQEDARSVRGELDDKDRDITNLNLLIQQHGATESDQQMQLDHLRAANKAIADERDDLQAELDAKSATITRLEEVVENLQLSLDRSHHHTDQVAALEEELSAYKAEVHRLQQCSKEDRDQWDTQVSEWERRYSALQEEYNAKAEDQLAMVDEQNAIVEELIKEERARMQREFDQQLDELAQQLTHVEEVHKAEQQRWVAEMSAHQGDSELATKLQTDVDALKALVVELESETERLEQEKTAGLALLQAKGDALANAQEEAELIQRQSEHLQHQADAAVRQREDLEMKYLGEISALSEKISVLEQEVIQARESENIAKMDAAEAVSRLEESFRETMEEKEKLQSKLHSVILEAENDKSMHDIEANNQMESMEQEIALLKHQLDQVSDPAEQLDRLQHELNQVQEEKSKIEGELVWSANALNEVMNEMQALQDANAELMEEHRALADAANSASSTMVERLSAENDALNAKLQGMQEASDHASLLGGDGEETKIRIGALESQLADREALVADYQKYIPGIEAQVDALEKERNDAIEELQSIRDECSQLRETIGSREEDFARLQHDMDEQKLEIESLRRELSVSPGTATFTINGDVVQELDLTKQQNDLLQKELTSAKNTITKYKSELRAKSAEADEWRIQLEENTHHVQQEIQEISDTITMLADDKAAAEERAVEAEEKMVLAMRENESLEERLNNCQRELDRRAQRLKDLLDERSELQATALELEQRYQSEVKKNKEESHHIEQEARINMEEVKRLQERIDSLQLEHSAQLEATLTQLQDVRKSSLEHQEEAERMARRYELVLAKKNKLDKRITSMQAKLKRQTALIKAQKSSGAAATTATNKSSQQSSTRETKRSTIANAALGISEVRLADISSEAEDSIIEASDVLDDSSALPTPRSGSSRTTGTKRKPLGPIERTPKMSTKSSTKKPNNGATLGGTKGTRALYDDGNVSALFGGGNAAAQSSSSGGASGSSASSSKSARPKRKPLGVISSRASAEPRRKLSSTESVGGEEEAMDESAAASVSSWRRPGALASPSSSLLAKRRRARTNRSGVDLIAAASSGGNEVLAHQPDGGARRSRRARKSISQAGLGEEDAQNCPVQ